MIVHVPNVLNAEQLARCREIMKRASWIDGRVTAGHQSAQVKHNRQLAENSPEARELGDLIVAALERNPLFITATLPLRVFPPLFNRYEAAVLSAPISITQSGRSPARRCASALIFRRRYFSARRKTTKAANWLLTTSTVSMQSNSPPETWWSTRRAACTT